MSKKKKVFFGLLVIFVGCLFFDLFSLQKVFCSSSYDCHNLSTSSVSWLFSVTTLSLFFLLLSFGFKDRVFESWCSFARIAAPVVLIASMIINIDSHYTYSGVLMNFDREINLAYILFAHLIFILGSAWQMYRGFRAKE